MKKFLSSSFRHRLFAAFLAASLIPLIICTSLLIQILRMRLTENEKNEAEISISAVIKSMDNMYSSLTDIVEDLQNDSLITNALTSKDASNSIRVYDRLYTITGQSRNYAIFHLYNLDGTQLYTTASQTQNLGLPTYFGLLQDARKEKGQLVFRPSHEEKSQGYDSLQAAAFLKDKDNKGAGYLVINLGNEQLGNVFYENYGARNDLLLLNTFWRPVYCSQPVLALPLSETIRGLLLEEKPLNHSSSDYIYNIKHHEESGLYAVLRQPRFFTKSTLNILYAVSGISMLVSVAIAIFMAIKISSQLFSPIGVLNRAFKNLEENKLETRIDLDRDDEIGGLANGFNSMVVALKRNQEQLIQNRHEINSAQIRMLQAQLNPHFLCNTLDTIKWESKLSHVPGAALMSANLADILRFCISGDEFVALKKEIEIICRYVEIQKIRLSNSFTFKVILPPELENCLVPKMILQPLVENAIIHGLEETDKGEIILNAEKTPEDFLKISITDNGKGMPEHVLKAYSERKREFTKGHLGLYNADTILSKYYGESFGLTLKNNEAGGAVASAVLPAYTKENTKYAESFNS